VPWVHDTAYICKNLTIPLFVFRGIPPLTLIHAEIYDCETVPVTERLSRVKYTYSVSGALGWEIRIKIDDHMHATAEETKHRLCGDDLSKNWLNAQLLFRGILQLDDVATWKKKEMAAVLQRHDEKLGDGYCVVSMIWF
jgi:hypothetical protein